LQAAGELVAHLDCAERCAQTGTGRRRGRALHRNGRRPGTRDAGAARVAVEGMFALTLASMNGRCPGRPAKAGC